MSTLLTQKWLKRNYFQLKTRKYQRYTVAIIITTKIMMIIIAMLVIIIINIDSAIL